LWMLLLLFDSFSSVRRALLGEEDNWNGYYYYVPPFRYRRVREQPMPEWWDMHGWSERLQLQLCCWLHRKWLRDKWVIRRKMGLWLQVECLCPRVRVRVSEWISGWVRELLIKCVVSVCVWGCVLKWLAWF
jgi:hypothetical protein